MIRDIPIKVEKMESLGTELKKTISTIIQNLKSKPGALLPILHKIQDTISYIPTEALPLIATELQLSRAEVHGVVSFYHHFRTLPAGKNILYICRAEACQAMGSAQLEQQLKEHLNINLHETTQDGQLTLEPVYCLGNCACSPAIRINNTIYGRMTMDKTKQLLETVEEESQ